MRNNTNVVFDATRSVRVPCSSVVIVNLSKTSSSCFVCYTNFSTIYLKSATQASVTRCNVRGTRLTEKIVIMTGGEGVLTKGGILVAAI